MIPVNSLRLAYPGNQFCFKEYRLGQKYYYNGVPATWGGGWGGGFPGGSAGKNLCVMQESESERK